jgi:hypothetical protein
MTHDAKPVIDLHAQDLAFMRWVRSASKKALGAALKMNEGWRRVAIDRELQRRIIGCTTNSK